MWKSKKRDITNNKINSDFYTSNSKQLKFKDPDLIWLAASWSERFKGD